MNVTVIPLVSRKLGPVFKVLWPALGPTIVCFIGFHQSIPLLVIVYYYFSPLCQPQVAGLGTAWWGSGENSGRELKSSNEIMMSLAGGNAFECEYVSVGDLHLPLFLFWGLHLSPAW
jgi:hypothetical protein